MRSEILAAMEAGGFDNEGDDSDDDGDGGAFRLLYSRCEEILLSFRKYDGKLGQISFAWFHDGVCHSFERSTEWYEASSSALVETVDEAKRSAREQRRSRSVEESLRLHSLADQMARHHRFIEATNEAKRAYMAEQLFPEEEYAASIADRAVLIYWWEVEPVERVTFVEKVRHLWQQGERVSGIAAILQVSQEKVRRAVAVMEKL
jgi:hypothetical protein